MITATEISWQELKQMILGLAEQSKEITRSFEELREQSKETDRRIQETDRQMQETDRRMQETDRYMRRMRDELNAQLGKLGNRLGDFVQYMVKPSVVKLFRNRGLPVHQVLPNMEARDEDGRLVMEVDLLVIDSDVAVAVECKSRAGIDDVQEHLERLANFKRCFPRFADLRLQGAIAAMVMPEEVARFAYRQGLYVLAQHGELVEVLNDDGFRPREW